MTTLQQARLQKLRATRALLAQQQAQQAAEEVKRLADSDYRRKAREQQLPPEGDWRIWLILAGRGFGKTWTGSKWLLEKALQQPGTEWAVVAPTFGDVRRICVEGPSGIIKSAQPGQIRFYNKSNGQINLANGSVIHMISADEPDRARGLNLAGAWCDEFAAWRYEETWTEGLVPALRIGNPQVVITTTPRPTRLLKALLKRSDGSVVVTRGSTFDNAQNLSQAALEELKARYDGTRIGRQELYGEVLEDVDGALWTLANIENTRLDKAPEMKRIVVAVDPAVTSGPDSDETGIVVAGLGIDGRGYILADRSTRDTPLGWAKRVIQAFEDFQADRIVAEKNQGGDLVEMNLKQVSPAIPYKGITAKQGKRLRAEPIAALYEQGRISHIGNFDALEQQMTEWVPDSGSSPDRLDALVHALTELGFMGGGSADRFLASISTSCDKCGMPIDPQAQNCRYCGNTNATGQEGSPFMPFAYPT